MQIESAYVRTDPHSVRSRAHLKRTDDFCKKYPRSPGSPENVLRFIKIVERLFEKK
jgi:hypothetical protein